MRREDISHPPRAGGAGSNQMHVPAVRHWDDGRTAAKIKNSDTACPCIMSMPRPWPPMARKGSTFPRLAGQENVKTFTHPEVVVKFQCDVHNWMFAYVGVMSNPYFAITDDNGNFKIPNLPPGDYTLTAYHFKAHGKTSPGVSQTIKVEGDKPVTANFTVEVPPPASVKAATPPCETVRHWKQQAARRITRPCAGLRCSRRRRLSCWSGWADW